MNTNQVNDLESNLDSHTVWIRAVSAGRYLVINRLSGPMKVSHQYQKRWSFFDNGGNALKVSKRRDLAQKAAEVIVLTLIKTDLYVQGLQREFKVLPCIKGSPGIQ